MINIEIYKDDILNANFTDLTCSVHKKFLKLSHISCTGNCRECKKNVMKWLLSECQILDDAEKRYLKGVIRPFKNEVLSIRKVSAVSEQIVIQMKSQIEIRLPCFEKGTMYQGMEEGNKYTVEELGL